MFMYLIFVFYMFVLGEVKIKLMQYLVKEFCFIGIQLDILVCCFVGVLLVSECFKIVLFINVVDKVVILLKDVDSIYCIFVVFKVQGMDQLVVDCFGFECNEVDLFEWEQVFYVEFNFIVEVNIGMIGKYVELFDVYKLVNEVFKYVGFKNCFIVNIYYIDL